MVLAKVMSPEENKEIMKAMIDQLFPVKNIATPYMYHHIDEREGFLLLFLKKPYIMNLS